MADTALAPAAPELKRLAPALELASTYSAKAAGAYAYAKDAYVPESYKSLVTKAEESTAALVGPYFAKYIAPFMTEEYVAIVDAKVDTAVVKATAIYETSIAPKVEYLRESAATAALAEYLKTVEASAEQLYASASTVAAPYVSAVREAVAAARAPGAAGAARQALVDAVATEWTTLRERPAVKAAADKLEPAVAAALARYDAAVAALKAWEGMPAAVSPFLSYLPGPLAPAAPVVEETAATE